MPLSTFLWIICKILSISVSLGKNLCIKFPLSIRSLSSFRFWKNNLSGLWIVSDMMPSWNGEFSSKPRLILGLWLIYLYFDEVMKVYGADPGVVQHLAERYYYLLLCHRHCFVLCMPFVFPVSIFDPPGIPCVTFEADWCGQAFFFSILLFPDLPTAFLIHLVWVLHVVFLLSSLGPTPSLLHELPAVLYC